MLILLILYKNDRNVRFVLFMKTSIVIEKTSEFILELRVTRPDIDIDLDVACDGLESPFWWINNVCNVTHGYCLLEKYLVSAIHGFFWGGEMGVLYILETLQMWKNLKYQIRRDFNQVIFRKFITSLVQQVKILGVYKNCKSRYWLQIRFFIL